MSHKLHAVQPAEAAAPQSAAHTPARPGRAAVARAGQLAIVQRMARLPIQRAGCACGGGSSPCHCHDADEERIQRAPIQTSLTINEPGDEYEQEAERTADHVMRTPAAAWRGGGGGDAAAAPGRAPAVVPSIRPYVQRRAAGPAAAATEAPASGPMLEHRLAAESPNGRPLHEGVRTSLETRFGVDFGGVRVHTGPSAAALSDDLGAAAFTHGRDIYFGAGMYAPGTIAGQRLLAHELTHVVQQAGGSAPGSPAAGQGIQRAPNVESKWYYFNTFGPLKGKAVHEGVESRLLDDKANKDLIVEAPIPGATTNKLFTTTELDHFDVVGRADLYKSSDSASGSVIGVRGSHEEKEKDKKYAERKRDYVTLRTGGVRAASGKTKWQPSGAAGNKIAGTFPTTFAVADLKPLAVVKAGEGRAQVANYVDGLTSFVSQAKADGALTQTGTVTGKTLDDLHIPPGLDYWQLDSEPPGRPAPGNFIVGDKRYWVAAGSGSGLYYYFWLDDPPPTKKAREKQEKVLADLEPVRKGLTFPEPGPTRTIQLTRRPGAPRVVQRQPAPATRPTRDWTAEGIAWEEKRAAWDKASAKPFLKSSEGQAMERRADAEKRLKGPATGTSSFAHDAKAFHRIELWQGLTGMALGKFRFLLGGTFDKIVGFYERIRTRFQGWHKRVSGISESGIGIGWKKKLVGALLYALKIGFSELLQTLFTFFANCIHGILDKVVRKFQEEISEELGTHVEELHKKFEEFSTKFKEEFESRFGSWDQFISDISDIAKWGQIAADLITLIRIGVQVISCITPPALGCLWGLVVQLAIESGLNLIIGTKWFERNIVRPTVRNLIKRFAGPAYQSLLDGALDLVGLTEFAKNVKECHPNEDDDALANAVVNRIPMTGVDGADAVKKRDDWYQKNTGEVNAAYKAAFGNAKKETPSGDDEQLEKRTQEEIGKAQKQIRVTIGWPDQKAVDESWRVLNGARPDLVDDNGQPVTGREIIDMADDAAREGMPGAKLEATIKSVPADSSGKRSASAVRQAIRGSSSAGPRRPGGSPGPGIPDLSIRKRYDWGDSGKLPGGVGPQIFTPPPGQPEKDPTVLPGKAWEF